MRGSADDKWQMQIVRNSTQWSGHAGQIARKHEILRGEVGSGAHGTGLAGHEDRDEMGVFIEPQLQVCGLSPLDHYIWRTQPEGERSGRGDIDLSMYSARKFCRLAAQGNPSVVMLLWLPSYEVCTPLGRELIDMRGAFLSRESGERYLGYLVSQKRALLGEKSARTHRPELVERFGFDTKFAMHSLRLGLQGIEYIGDGHLSEPVREPDRTLLLQVRNGEVPYNEVLRLITDAESRLRALVANCTAICDRTRIDHWLSRAHLARWMGTSR